MIGGAARAPRPTILILAPGYFPGTRYGGPVRSVANIAQSLSDAFDFRILTLDRDLGSAEPYASIRRGEWQPVVGTTVRYLAPSETKIRVFSRLIDEANPDLLYLNSAFHPAMSVRPLAAWHSMTRGSRPPLLLAPRGELLDGAMRLKGMKKRFFVRLARATRFWGGISWHASSDEEARAVSIVSGGAAVFVAPPIAGIGGGAAPYSPPEAGGPLRVLFASRISRKKNLEFCLDVLARCDRRVALTIAGSPEDILYWRECERLLSAMPEAVTVKVAGHLSSEELGAQLAATDLFMLPTRSENYGHSIAEALQASTPVLISDQTYFRGLQAAGAGWDLPLAQRQLWIDAVRTCADEAPEDRARRRSRALAYANSVLQRSESIRSTAAMFRAAMMVPQ